MQIFGRYSKILGGFQLYDFDFMCFPQFLQRKTENRKVELAYSKILIVYFITRVQLYDVQFCLVKIEEKHEIKIVKLKIPKASYDSPLLTALVQGFCLWAAHIGRRYRARKT